MTSLQANGFAVSGRYLLPTARALAHRATQADMPIDPPADWPDPIGLLEEQAESGDTSLDAWAARWMASRVDLKPKTQVGYISLLRTQILPAFGSRPISRIRPIDVQEWIARMQNAGLSPSRIRQAASSLPTVSRSVRGLRV
jgi:hypothetical protein